MEINTGNGFESMASDIGTQWSNIAIGYGLIRINNGATLYHGTYMKYSENLGTIFITDVSTQNSFIYKYSDGVSSLINLTTDEELATKVTANRISQINWAETGYFQAYVDNSTWIDIVTYTKMIENINSRAVVKESYLGNGVDLNTVTTCGFYRLGSGHLNSPSNVGHPSDWSQLIVVHAGGDTISQIITDYSCAVLLIRSGNPTECGGTGGWTAWKRLIDNECFIYDSSTNTLTINI